MTFAEFGLTPPDCMAIGALLGSWLRCILALFP